MSRNSLTQRVVLLALLTTLALLTAACVGGPQGTASSRPGRSVSAPGTAPGTASLSPSAIAPVPTPAATPAPTPPPPPRPEPEMVPAEMRLDVADRGEIVPRQAVLAAPGERLEFRAGLTKPAATAATRSSANVGGIESSRKFLVEVTGGTFEPTASGAIAWTAPESPGLQTLTFRLTESVASATPSGPADSAIPAAARERVLDAKREVSVLVEYPFDRSGKGDLNGYPIGIYPNENGREATPAVARKPEVFAPPKSFVRVTPETEGLLVSPHFTLGEFSPRSERGQAHFIALQQRLLDFLEALRTEVQHEYGPEARVVILRAYMSPNEHLRLERKGIKYALFTRYQYGDSAAIVVDSGGKGTLGDLNKDGTVDKADADALADLVDRVQTAQKTTGWLQSFEKPVEPDWPQTPFVAFDLRGIKTRQ